MKVIFTLEHGYGNVVARHAVDVRICSCPKRDLAQEEKKHMQTTKEVKKVYISKINITNMRKVHLLSFSYDFLTYLFAKYNIIFYFNRLPMNCQEQILHWFLLNQ